MKRLIVAAVMAITTTYCPDGGAQERFPARPVTMLFPYPPGGFDAMARAFSEALSKVIGQAVIVVNRDGAAGRIAFEQLAGAKPDGSTLAFSPATPLTSVPHLQKDVSYRYDSFDYVCQVFENTLTLSVPAKSPYRSLAELIEFARTHPGRVTFGHPGVGSGPHLAGAAFAQQLGLELQGIPYRGGGQMLTALVAGEIDFSSPGVASTAPRRDIRVLALFSRVRSPFLPEVPTVTELGLPGLASDPQGVFAPKGTAREVLSALERACRQATESADFKRFAASLYQTVEYLPGAELLRLHREDSASKEALVRSLNLRSN